MISTDINTALPEIILAVYAMAALMLAVYGGKDRLSGFIFWATAGVMAILGLMIAFAPAGTTTAFNGSFVNDDFAR